MNRDQCRSKFSSFISSVFSRNCCTDQIIVFCVGQADSAAQPCGLKVLRLWIITLIAGLVCIPLIESALLVQSSLVLTPAILWPYWNL
jgi:hypothetical protein